MWSPWGLRPRACGVRGAEPGPADTLPHLTLAVRSPRPRGKAVRGFSVATGSTRRRGEGLSPVQRLPTRRGRCGSCGHPGLGQALAQTHSQRLGACHVSGPQARCEAQPVASYRKNTDSGELDRHKPHPATPCDSTRCVSPARDAHPSLSSVHEPASPWLTVVCRSH